MNKDLSVSLDLMRLGAALVVFLGHLSHGRFTGEWFAWFRGAEHDAVIVFFVLSGFVISHVTGAKEKQFRTYAVNRFSRLYSVVLPAILLTLLADSIGRGVNPELYQGVYRGDAPWIRIIANGLFLQEFWGLGIRLFSNGPFWSMSYEFAYYGLFAAWFYLQGWNRLVACLLGVLIVGPNILILGPIWVAGVMLERMAPSNAPRVKLVSAMGLSLLAFIGYKLNIQDFLPVYDSLAWSGKFLHDYVVGLFVFVQIYAWKSLIMSRPSGGFWQGGNIEKTIRLAASYTFSLYLYHFPLLMMVYALFTAGHPRGQVGALTILLVVLLVLFLVVVVGTFTERKKQFFRNLLSGVSMGRV